MASQSEIEIIPPNSPRSSETVATLIKSTGFLYLHGTVEGVLQDPKGGPSKIDYQYRSPPPIHWEDKIKYALLNRPPVSVGRLIPGCSQSVFDLWSPVGLQVTDGKIVGTGSHVLDKNGDLKKPLPCEAFPYSPHSLPENFYGIFEIGVKNPTFKRIYVSPFTLESPSFWKKDPAYQDLAARAKKLGRELGLPVLRIGKNGTQQIIFSPRITSKL